MVNNTSSPSLCTYMYRNGFAPRPFSAEERRANNTDELVSNNDTCMALSSFPMMKKTRIVQHQEDGDAFPPKLIVSSKSTRLQVRQVVVSVQEGVARDEKEEGPETYDESSGWPCDVELEMSERSECVDGNGFQQQDFESELCNRLEEVAIGFDVVDHDQDDSVSYESTDDAVGYGLLTLDDEVGASTQRKDIETDEMTEPVTLAKPSVSSIRTTCLHMLPILTTTMAVKGVNVPSLLRGSDGRNSRRNDLDNNAATSELSTVDAKAVGRSSRSKFQFSENELRQHVADEEDTTVNSTIRPAVLNTYRRLSASSKIAVAVPLRRKSFSTKRSPSKSTGKVGLLHEADIATREVTRMPARVTKSTDQLSTERRKSASACHISASSISHSHRTSRSVSVAKHQVVAFNSKKYITSRTLSGSPWSSSASLIPSPVRTTQAKLVLRVRECTSDSVSKLVIAKKPVQYVTWHWNDQWSRVPCMRAATYMELGPVQHGIILRQLRYVKLIMSEVPWAKAHLRALLSKYTAKEMSKEELYPQLSALSQQVQREISLRARQGQALAARKQRVTVTLTLATSVVNHTKCTKFGRHGRPHASRLLYNPKFPLELHWRRKHGKWSTEYLAVDTIQVIETADSFNVTGDRGSFGRGNKNATAVAVVDPESCLSLVTPFRSLNLQVASSLQREWLANAVRDLVSFAQDHKASKASMAISSDKQ